MALCPGGNRRRRLFRGIVRPPPVPAGKEEEEGLPGLPVAASVRTGPTLRHGTIDRPSIALFGLSTRHSTLSRYARVGAERTGRSGHRGDSALGWKDHRRPTGGDRSP